jgi:cysteine sulfinate desulfinase/cysteine desulfurase-like protein
MIESTRKELIDRFGKILKDETIFGSLWSIADEAYINKTLDELIEKLADSALSSGHKVTIPPGSDIGWMVAGAGMDKQAIQQTLDREKKIREVTEAYEKYMGFNPLEWCKMERLQKFLLTKSVEEIKTFAKWCKREYSVFTPAKARLYPNMVIDIWPMAFEKATIEQNNTQDAIREAIYGKSN